MKHFCRECFKEYIDSCATNSHLLLGKFPLTCEGCGETKKVVIAYYKYGEHTVSEDGTKIIRW